MSLIKEIRSLEGKEHKLVRFKQHRVFNLRCLKENVVPKSVKINFKQFKPLNERKILCKTHRQILNSRVRKTNKTIDKFNKDIELLRSNIKNKVSTSHFESITDVIFKSKEKLFKQVKQRQVRKFRHLQKTPAHRNTPVPEHISKKWVINLASKDLSPGEVKLLQKGPKFAVSTPKVPITEYIAVTKQICDKLGENTEGVDCSEYYQKTKDLLQDYTRKRAAHPNISKMERDAIKTLKEDNTRVVLTADKGVAMVVMDKSSYVEKCMALLQDTSVYQPCRDLTGQIHRQVQSTLHKLKEKHGKDHQWTQLKYKQLLPPGNSSPPARFYGLPKIHKANCPIRPIVSACRTSTYNLAKYLTKILKVYVGHSSSFVKDSKDLTDKLQSIRLQDNEELVSFDVSALFTSIPVNQALDVINQLIIQHQTDMDFKSKIGQVWYEVADHLDREDVMALLKVVLNNCVFSFQNKFYKQLHGAAMGSPCSPVVANIYMEYFEKRALGPELPMSFTINTWLRYVDDVLTIVKKGTHDSLLNYLNSVDSNIKFTIEPPNEQGAIPFLDTFPRPSGNKITISVYRKPTHMDRYLDFNSNHPKSAKRAVVRALTDRAKNMCSSPELLAEEMDHLGKVLRYNNYPKWMIAQHGRNSSERNLIDPETGNEVKKSISISAPYFPGLSESFKQLFRYTPMQVCFKGQKTIKSLLMHPKDKVDPSLKKDIIYQWSCTKPNCKSSYIGETSRSLCERAKEHSKEGSNSAIYHHCSSKGHPQPNVDQFKVIDQEKSQIAREAKEAIHIRKLDPELNRNIGKMVIPRVFDSLLGIKPKNPRIASLLSQETGSQDIGIGLTQFHSRIDKRVNLCSNRAQRARNFFSN